MIASYLSTFTTVVFIAVTLVVTAFGLWVAGMAWEAEEGEPGGPALVAAVILLGACALIAYDLERILP